MTYKVKEIFRAKDAYSIYTAPTLTFGECVMPQTVIDLAGQTFGSLTVIARAGTGSSGRAQWDCQCTCGRTHVARGDNLRSGRTKSCGQCGQYHVQTLNSDNALYVIDGHTSVEKDHHNNRVAFAAVYVRETGLLAVKPRIPTHIKSTLTSGLGQLAVAGLIRHIENRPNSPRWAKEERVVFRKAYHYECEKDLDAAWEPLGGRKLNQGRIYIPPEVPVSEPFKPTPEFTALLEEWARD